MTGREVRLAGVRSKVALGREQRAPGGSTVSRGADPTLSCALWALRTRWHWGCCQTCPRTAESLRNFWVKTSSRGRPRSSAWSTQQIDPEPLQAQHLLQFNEAAAQSQPQPLAPLRPSPVAQLVKNPAPVRETPVRFVGREDPLEKGQAAHSNNLGLRLWLR